MFDLRNRDLVDMFIGQHKPKYIFLAAARAGGIGANMNTPARFIYDNLMIESNVIDSARVHDVEKLLFLGSSCIYPKDAPQPIKEGSLLGGALEPTNEAYAVAKIAGIKLCQNYNREYGFNAISLMPCNLYGPNDNFDLESGHVIPALIRKFVEAETSDVVIWGTGKPRREFMYVDDLADACHFLMQNYDSREIINVGPGFDVTIDELAHKVRTAVGKDNSISYDLSKPDGVFSKLMDSSKINNLGWEPATDLDTGLRLTYEWYLDNIDTVSRLPSNVPSVI